MHINIDALWLRRSMVGKYRAFQTGRVRFGAAVSALDISAPDISAPGLSGTRTFIFGLVFFCSYVVSVCSSLRSR